MKKSLLALAALGAFAGAASAQSSVTVYGGLDQAFGKNLGTKNYTLDDTGYGSRLGFRGVEDLGNGLSAVFGLEHRFEPSEGKTGGSGATTDSGLFWGGHSWVGLKGAFGQVTVGRHYTAAFLDVQNQVDPWGGSGFSQMRSASMMGLGSANIAKVRVSNSVRYDGLFSGFKIAATYAEKQGPSTTATEAPYSLALSYSGGPLWVGVGYESTQFDGENWTSLGIKYNLGFMTLHGAYNFGTYEGVTHSGVDVQSWMLGVTVPVGPGKLLVGYSGMKLDEPINTGNLWNDRSNKVGVSYLYNLSKRTYLYAGFAYGTGNFAYYAGPVGDRDYEKNAYELGIHHVF